MLNNAPLNDFSEAECRFNEEVLEFLALLIEEALRTDNTNKRKGETNEQKFKDN